MANEHLGRVNKIKLDGTTAICFRTLSEDINATLVDITDSCSDGNMTVLAEPGDLTFNWSIEGMVKDHVLREKMLSGNVVFTAAEIEYWDGATLTGDIAMSAVSFSSPYNEAETFTATLQSNGAMTFTAATT